MGVVGSDNFQVEPDVYESHFFEAIVQSGFKSDRNL